MNRLRVDDGAEIAYEVDDFTSPWLCPSDKETIFLYHGSCETSEVFTSMVPLLAQHYRVIRMDERGLGKSAMPSGSYKPDIGLFVADIIAVADELQLKKFHLFAQSSGGLACISLAISYPERLHSLVLCQTPYRLPAELKPIYSLDSESISAAILKYGFREWQRKVPGYRVFNLDRVSPDIVKWYAEFRSRNPDEVTAARTEWAFEIDLSKDIKSIHVPTAMIFGQGSYQTSTDSIQFVKEQNASIEIHTISGDLGQCLHVVIPEEIARTVLRYLDKFRKARQVESKSRH